MMTNSWTGITKLVFMSNREIRKKIKRQTRDDIGEVIRVMGTRGMIESSNFVDEYHTY